MVKSLGKILDNSNPTSRRFKKLKWWWAPTIIRKKKKSTVLGVKSSQLKIGKIWYIDSSCVSADIKLRDIVLNN